MTSKFFLTGFMGSGKTFWGKKWAEKNQLSFFDLDDQVEEAAGDTITHIFEMKGEEHFRDIEKYALREFAGRNNFILACGGGTPCFFDNMQWMNKQGITIYLRASASDILKRLMKETQDRPLVNKIDPPELLVFIEQKVKEREPYYKQAMHILDAGTLTAHSLSAIVKMYE